MPASAEPGTRQALQESISDGQTDRGLLLQVLDKLHLTMGRMADQMDADTARRLKVLQNIYPIWIPGGTGKSDGSGNLLIASAEQFGPRTGIAWDVKRVTVSGLTSSDVVYLYKTATPTNSGAVAQNLITQFAANTTGKSTAPFLVGGQCIVLAGESLMITSQYAGSGTITASEQVFVSWEGISIAEEYLGDYLL